MAKTPKTVGSYYMVRRDFRHCVFPLCGGFWIQRVNRTLTKCIDGRIRDECYVPEIDCGPAGVAVLKTSIDGYIFRSSLVSKIYNGFGNLGQLRATEIWTPGGTTPPSGVFVRVKATSGRHTSTPRPTCREEKLNSVWTAKIVAPNLDGARAGRVNLARANHEISEADGIIVADDRITVRGPGGWVKGRLASQFYLKVARKLGIEGGAKPRGDLRRR